MSKVIFYKQAREDGGIRTGIEIDDTTYLERFESVGDDQDPALVWYLDVRCEGKGLPGKPQPARAWLITNGNLIKKGLKKLAADLRAGIDVDSYPLRREIANPPKETSMVIVCSATRRMAAINIAKEIWTLSNDWDEIIRNLPEAHAATW